MKYIPLALLLLLPTAYADTLKTEPLTTTDLATILHVSAKRYALTFSTTENLILRYDSQNKHTNTPIGKTKSLSIVVFDSGTGTHRSLGFIIENGGSSLLSYFPAPESEPANGFEKTIFEKNVFSVTGLLKEDFSTFTYRIQILPESK